MKKILLVLSFLLIATGLFAQDAQKERGFYFSIGGGPAIITYPEPLDSYMDAAADLPEVTRIRMDLNIALGGAVTPRLYIVGSVSGYGDRLDDGISYIQLNTYLTGIGARFYPFTTGLVLGADVGLTKMVIMEEGWEDTTSDSGLGYDLMLAYDFDRTPTGFGLIIGLKAGGYDIEGETVNTVSLFGNLVWK